MAHPKALENAVSECRVVQGSGMAKPGVRPSVVRMSTRKRREHMLAGKFRKVVGGPGG